MLRRIESLHKFRYVILPRIALIFEYPTLNGGERSMLAAVDQLCRCECAEFVALAPSMGPLADQLARRVIVHIPLELTSDRLSDPAAARGSDVLSIWRDEKLQRLRAAIEATGADLIHANSLAMGRLAGAVAKDLRVPTTAHLRDIVRLSASAVFDLNRNRGLVAVSSATRDFHVQQGVTAGRIEVIYNGVDTETFHPRPAAGLLRRELGLPAESKLALNVGQICLRKAQDVLARAAVKLRDGFPMLHWVICGERYSAKQETMEFEERFRRTFADAGMASRLHCLGYRDDMPVLFNEVDLLVHAARQEPLGRVLLEGAASGTPIVATRVGGSEEIITHGETGWLVPANDADRLAAGIARLLDSPELRAGFAQRARRCIETRFSSRQSADRLWHWWSKHFCLR